MQLHDTKVREPGSIASQSSAVRSTSAQERPQALDIQLQRLSEVIDAFQDERMALREMLERRRGAQQVNLSSNISKRAGLMSLCRYPLDHIPALRY